MSQNSYVPKIERVALIQPPQIGDIHVPLGLLALASYIKKFNFKPNIINLNVLFNWKNYPVSFLRQAAENILSHCPQVLGFTVMCNNFPSALLIAEECKKIAPQIPIIFGGPEVSFEETEVLETFKQVDIIVRGEGEITLVEVLKALEEQRLLSDILGITYRENGRIKRNPDRPFIKDLDELPFFDFSLLPQIEKYKSGDIEAGRGCPFNCTFCSSCKMWKRKFRIKSPLRLARELKQAYNIFKKNDKSQISLNHDNLLASRKMTDEFLSLMAKERISWACSTRLDALDEDMIKKLKQAGCKAVFLGIESGSAEMQKEIKKNLPLSKLPQILNLLQENEIEPTLSFIIGFPDENEFQINQSLLMALNSKHARPAFDIQVHPFTFLKGSELYEKAKDKFEQAEFCVSNISPVVTNLPAELALIEKYPRIFPSFHFLGGGTFSSQFLHRLCECFNLLIEHFPSATLSFIHNLSITPVQLVQKMISLFEKDNLDFDFVRGLYRHQLEALIAFFQDGPAQTMEMFAGELVPFFDKVVKENNKT